mmetsp:Transcript_87373/g.187363  ORF Transcript_87373/g.187363 Transcript_87373/m.187363 type:complete len:352 (-) Transcript_87373:67-1122(-)
MSGEEKMGYQSWAPEQSAMNPLVMDRLHKPRTVFFPGHRIKMNIVPMFLNLFVPWGVFIFCCALTSFRMMYYQPTAVGLILVCVFAIWLLMVGGALWMRRHDPSPTWFSYGALMFGIAVVAGPLCGLYNYEYYSQRYNSIQDLKVIHGLDASKELGQNVMDAGVVYFARGSQLDVMKSWHFHHRTTYCVAPIVSSNSSLPETQSYDFWAVGKDCCSLGSSDFRCGAWGETKARSGIRVISDEDMPYYRLAVQQAETLYGVMASHPLFFEWSDHPEAEVKSWARLAFRNYLFLVGFAFVVSLFCLSMATLGFSFIGRGRSAYEMNFNDDTAWRQGGSHAPRDYEVRSYSTLS